MKFNNPKKILIVRLDRIGDVILSTPAIRAVKECFSGSYLAVMVKPENRGILAGSPFIDDLLVYDKDKAQKGFWETARLILLLRKKRFDLAIILHPTVRSHLVCFLAGIPVRVGYDRKGSVFLTMKIPHKKELGLMHEREYALDMVRRIGCETSKDTLFVATLNESERSVRKVLLDAGITDDMPLVSIHPAASCPSKRWPAERFAEVANRLMAKRNTRVVIICGKTEAEFGNAVARSIQGDSLNLSGKTTVAELASVLRRSNLLISCDSGPVHVACAVGTPVVAIFGRSDKGLSPRRWGPTGAHDIVLHKYVGCETCLAHNCDKDFQCLRAVTVDDVLAAAGRILKA